MTKQEIYHQGLYNNYFISLGDDKVIKIEISQEQQATLAEVYLGIIHYYDRRQHAYFVNIGREEVYVKERKAEKPLAVGSSIIVEIISESIKGKKARATMKLSNTAELSANGVDLEANHYSQPKLLFSPQRVKSTRLASGDAYLEFKEKKFANNLYHHFDLLGAVESLLNPINPTSKGAVFTIEELETLTAIDVDAGSFKAGGNFAYQLNLYIAPLIIKKIRQLDISGTVLIDFVNMSKADNQQFLKEVKPLAKGFVLKEFTKTGLLELTIPKRKSSLWQKSLYRQGFSYKIKPEIIIDYRLDRIIHGYLSGELSKAELSIPSSHFASTQRMLKEKDYLHAYPDLQLELVREQG